MTVFICIFLLAVGCVILWQFQPERMARLGRNAWIGIRVGRAVESDEAWADVHAKAWPYVRLGTVLLIVGAVVGLGIYLIAPEYDEWGLWIAIAGFLLWFVLIIWGAIRGNRV